MKAGIGFCFLLLAGAGWGQITDVFGEVQKSWIIDERSGVEGSGSLPNRDPELKDELTIENADSSRFEGDDFYMEGGVVLVYKGYRLSADKIEGNRSTEVVRLFGNGILVGEDDRVTGEAVEIDFKQNTYQLIDGKAVIPVSRTEGNTVAPFYFSAGKGRLENQHYHVVDGVLTPCDEEHPHFSFDISEGKIEPGRRVTLKDFALVVMGKTILKVPSLVIPLLDDRPRYLPEFGQSEEEGYYAKLRYATPIRGDDTLTTRLDLMTRLGVGIGGDWDYLSDLVSGGFGVYGLTGSNRTLVAKWLHRQQFGSTIFNLDSQWNRNNYLTAPQSSILSSRASLQIPSRWGQTGLTFFRTSSDTSTFSSVNQSTSLSDTRNWGSGIRSSVSLNLSQNKSSSSGSVLSSADRLDVRVNSSAEARAFSTDFLYQRSIPVGGTQSFASASDRTPHVTIRTDLDRLFGIQRGKGPVGIEASIGEFFEPSSARPLTRMTLGLDVNRTETYGKDTALRWNFDLDQGVYSDDTAKYDLNYGATLTQKLGGSTSLTTSYRHLKQYGFTPLAVDRTGRSDSFTFGLQSDFARGWNGRVTTGYDLLSPERNIAPWQLVNFSAGYQGRDSRFGLTGVYDTFNSSWGTFRIDGGVTLGGTRFGGALRYDGLRSTWAGGSFLMEGFKVGKVTTSMLLSYNGYTKKMDAQQYRLAYDLHCTEAVLEITDFRSGFRSGRQIGFFIRIKALPFGSDFGFGRRGQSIGGAGGYGF